MLFLYSRLMEVGTLQLTDSLKLLFRETAQQLKGSQRRQFMAKVVKELGVGGQTRAERELGWNRGTMRKGMQELTTVPLLTWSLRCMKPELSCLRKP